MALRRQALAEWRDRQILELCRLLNVHALHARTAIEAELHDAGLIDSEWDPARFAHARLDRLGGESKHFPVKTWVEPVTLAPPITWSMPLRPEGPDG